MSKGDAAKNRILKYYDTAKDTQALLVELFAIQESNVKVVVEHSRQITDKKTVFVSCGDVVRVNASSFQQMLKETRRHQMEGLFTHLTKMVQLYSELSGYENEYRIVDNLKLKGKG